MTGEFSYTSSSVRAGVRAARDIAPKKIVCSWESTAAGRWVPFESAEMVVLELRAERQTQTWVKESKLILSKRAEQAQAAAIRIQRDVFAGIALVLCQAIAESPDPLVALSEANVMLEVKIIDTLMVDQQ